MNLAEKLDRLAPKRNRAELSRQAGLPANAISDYINKGYWPRLDTAFSLARVLGVSLDWLANDAQNWPPPKSDHPSPSQLTDRELMMEVARRDRLEMIHFLERIEDAERVDWEAIRQEVSTFRSDEPIPQKSREIMSLVVTLCYLAEQAAGRYHPYYFANKNHTAMPGSNRPLKDFNYIAMMQRYAKIVDNPGFQAALARFLPFVPPEQREAFERVQFRDGSPFETPQPNVILHSADVGINVQVKGSNAVVTDKTLPAPKSSRRTTKKAAGNPPTGRLPLSPNAPKIIKAPNHN